jgi:hypothetical protein
MGGRLSHKGGEAYFSRSQMNDGYGADSGPSGGDSCRLAYRPNATSTVAIRNVRYACAP